MFAPAEFRRFQRARLALALRSLELIGKNAAMLMKLGQLAKAGANPGAGASKEAEDLIHGALRLRVNLMLRSAVLEAEMALSWVDVVGSGI